MFKSRTSCDFGEVSVPPRLPSSDTGEPGHRGEFSGATDTGHLRSFIYSRYLTPPPPKQVILNFYSHCTKTNSVWFSVLILFSQVLLQLCRRPVNVEKLVETQELQCLIIGLTSLWDQTSAPWRHQASRVLKAVSAVATSNTVPSLLGKNN